MQSKTGLLRILHIGWGFRPFRWGGLIEYAEDLIRAQAAYGHSVAYFCSGRHYPWQKTPALKSWLMGEVRVFEVQNPPVVVGLDRGTQAPLADLSDPVIEDFLKQALDAFAPDVVHIQELSGIPTSVIQLMVARRIPLVMSLHDYFPLCPTVKLVDYQRQPCERLEVGATCQLCCAEAPLGPQHLMVETVIAHTLQLTGGLVYKAQALWNSVARQLPLPRAPAPVPFNPPQPKASSVSAEAYQRRRDTNLELLSQIDLLLPVSSGVKQTYTQLGVAQGQMKVLNPVVAHLQTITPRQPRRASPLHFATLGGCASVPKGAQVILEALQILHQRGVGNFELWVYGVVAPQLQAQLQALPNVKLMGTYQPYQLNKLLEAVDVGIIPSVWAEAYGLVGPEMLAKGIPVIGNTVGGIPDYTLPGQTGWLNPSNDGAGLAQIMAQLIAQPEQVETLSQNLLAQRSRYVKTLEQHQQELLELYQSLRT